ncbi:MAG: DUF4013 domain-containing protein [Deltaproteobacteria bacterium]
MKDWQELLRYPLGDDRWILKVIIGSLITLVPVLNLVLLGYAVACIELGMQGRRQLPEWEAWRDYIRDALSAVLILLAYLLVPIVLTIVLSHIPLIGIVLGAVLILLAGALAPMALAAYTIRRDISEAFSLGDIIHQINNNLEAYLSGYLFLILSTCLGLTLIIALPYLACLWSLLIFYSTVVYSYLIGCLACGV